MKIAIIAHTLYPIKQPYAGGLEMITHLLCDKLTERGHEVDLYAHKDSDTNANLIPFRELASVVYNNDHNLAEGCGVDQRFLEEHIQYSMALTKIAQKQYDVIHNNSLHFQPLILGNLVQTPFITTLHTPPFPWLKMGSIAIGKDCNQYYTTVSKRLGQVWGEYIEDYEVVYNGIALDNWEYEDLPKQNYLVFVGRICKEKGVEIAINFALCSKTPLKIIGPISNEEYYNTAVQPYLSNPLIEYVGHLKQKEINQIMLAAKATLFFSTWEEPYGLVIAESLASGTPVIAFNKGAAPEIITDETGILIDEDKPYNPNELVRKLETLTSKDCRERAESFCGSDTMIENYENLYIKLRNNSNSYKNLLVV